MALWSNTDEASSKPKYTNHADKAATVGVDVVEANLGAAKGINTPGWVKYSTYTDAQGNTRHKSEVLVAMSSMTLDDDDDTIVADPVVTIGTQPANASVTAPAAATFTVAATATGGATLTYQWQIQQEGTGAWANISGAILASYTTGPTATGDAAGATDGDKYRVIVSAGNATPVTSSAVTLTVA